MAQNLNIVSARAPTKLGGGSSTWTGPPEKWLCRTWTVTHSTQKSYAGGKNSRITYKASHPSSDGRTRLTSVTKMESKGSVKVSTATSTCTKKGHTVEWDAKTKGILKGSSRWEILGWGDISEEKGLVTESWMIVYYSSGGVDVLSSRKQGMGSETADRCLGALKRLPNSAAKVRNSVVMDLRVVDIGLPWKE